MKTTIDVEIAFQRALQHHQAGQIVDAEQIYLRILSERPNHGEAIHLLGLIRFRQSDFLKAITLITRALEINPDFAAAHYNLGRCYEQISENEKAIRSYYSSLSLKPDDAECYIGLGNALKELKQFDEALASFDRAIGINPKFSEAHSNRGNVLNELNRFEEALASFDRAIGINPKFSETHNNRGNALKGLKRLHEALASYDKAIALKPDFAEAHSNRGDALKVLKRFDEALASYERVFTLKPDFFGAQSNLAKFPKGMIPDHLVSRLLQQWVCPSDKALEAKALFLKANLLRHLGKYKESFEVLLNANLLRQKEFEENIAGWREDNRKFQNEIGDWQAIVRDGANANTPKLLFILGPSRSGKTTVEFCIPENEVTKRGLEGRNASLAIKDLQDLRLEFNQQSQKSSSEVAQQVTDSLFYRQADATGKITHQLVTNTNPFLIKAAHIIFDLYPSSHFIFVYRDPIDNAADIFSTDYKEPQRFAFHAQTALEYVTWYHAVSDELVRKMEGRALKLNYADFVKNTELRVKSIAKLVGVDFEADPSQLDMADRTDASVYRKLFLELLEKN